MQTTQTPTAIVSTITPAMASEMLALNIDKNRKLRKDRVSLYADHMRNGQWMLTGEPIIFSEGQLINGQHRLMACVEAQTPFVSVIVRDVAEDAFTFIDSGLPRSVADLVAHSGYKHANELAAASRLVIAYEHGEVLSPKWQVSRSRSQMLDEINADPETYLHGIRLGAAGQDDGFLKSATTAMFVLLSRRVGSDIAGKFMESTFAGTGFAPGDPRLAMRRWVVQGERTSVKHLGAWIIAWNSFAKGESRKIIRLWRVGDLFPRFVSLPPDSDLFVAA